MAAPLVAVALGLWLAGLAAAQGDGGDETEEAGGSPAQELYDRHCAMCHGSDAEGMSGMHPGLRGAVDRLTADGVEVAIRKGRQVTPPMPAFEDRLSDAEIDDLIAYIGSLPSGPRNPDGDGMGGMGGMGDGGMMDGMMGDDGSDTLLWVAIVVLAALAAGLGGFLLARRSQ